MSKTSPLFTANDLFSNICSDCANELYELYKNKLKDEKLALMLMCCHLDVYFSEEMYEKCMANANFSLGNYLKYLGLSQFKAKNFITYLINLNKSNGWIRDPKDIQDEYEDNQWSQSDLKHKDRVIKILRYDPFEDADKDSRKFMFNLCSAYLQDESTIEDPHILQGVVELVRTYGQLRKVNKEIDKETTGTVNESRLKTLSAIKKEQMDLINKFAKENGISASTNFKGQKGSSSLAYFVKQLDEIHFTDAEINLFDIETCKSMRQFADISHSSILSQIRFNADELGEAVEGQTKKIWDLSDKLAAKEEENRLLKIKLKQLDNSIGDDLNGNYS